MNSIKLILQDKIKEQSVVSKDKESIVEIITSHDFESIIKEKGILQRHEEVPEEFVDILELCSNNDDIIMIKKLEKAISQISWDNF